MIITMDAFHNLVKDIERFNKKQLENNTEFVIVLKIKQSLYIREFFVTVELQNLNFTSPPNRKYTIECCAHLNQLQEFYEVFKDTYKELFDKIEEDNKENNTEIN